MTCIKHRSYIYLKRGLFQFCLQFFAMPPLEPCALGDPRRSIQVELAKGHGFSCRAQSRKSPAKVALSFFSMVFGAIPKFGFKTTSQHQRVGQALPKMCADCELSCMQQMSDTAKMNHVHCALMLSPKLPKKRSCSAQYVSQCFTPRPEG